jgi:hypothetical protein
LGACSTRNAVAPPTSPPAEKPWISLARTIQAGAQKPASAYVGASPIIAVPSAIRRIVVDSAAFRPCVSPSAPRTTAPIGRITKPTPNVATVSNSEEVSSPVGKNSLEIVIAKKP